MLLNITQHESAEAQLFEAPDQAEEHKTKAGSGSSELLKRFWKVCEEMEKGDFKSFDGII